MAGKLVIVMPLTNPTLSGFFPVKPITRAVYCINSGLNLWPSPQENHVHRCEGTRPYCRG